MKTVIFNEFNLKESEIERVETRLKVFMLDSDENISFARAFGGIQLPGGHLEDGENYIEALKREIKEEVGILLEDSEISLPFFEIKKYIKNYNNTNKNKINQNVYYIVHTDKKYNPSNINLTEDEKRGRLIIDKIKLNKFEEAIKENMATNPDEGCVNIEKETLLAYEEFKKLI